MRLYPTHVLFFSLKLSISMEYCVAFNNYCRFVSERPQSARPFFHGKIPFSLDSRRASCQCFILMKDGALNTVKLPPGGWPAGTVWLSNVPSRHDLSCLPWT